MYVRSAEAETNTTCAVYIFQVPTGRVGYKVFPNDQEYEKYLDKKKFVEPEKKIFFKPKKSLRDGHKNIQTKLTQKEADIYHKKWKKARNI